MHGEKQMYCMSPSCSLQPGGERLTEISTVHNYKCSTAKQLLNCLQSVWKRLWRSIITTLCLMYCTHMHPRGMISAWLPLVLTALATYSSSTCSILSSQSSSLPRSSKEARAQISLCVWCLNSHLALMVAFWLSAIINLPEYSCSFYSEPSRREGAPGMPTHWCKWTHGNYFRSCQVRPMPQDWQPITFSSIPIPAEGSEMISFLLWFPYITIK